MLFNEVWAGDDKAPWHIVPAVKNIDNFYPTRPFIYYATDILCTRKGVKTKWYEEQNFSFPNFEHYIVLPAFLRNDNDIHVEKFYGFCSSWYFFH